MTSSSTSERLASTAAGDAATREITVAHSPDSDDAFMFYGLATNKVRVPGLRFTHTLCDIETLNRKAQDGDGCTTSPPSLSTRIPTFRIITRCCRAEAAWATAMAR